MPEPVLRSEDFLEGYRVTTTASGLRIETIREHPRPLHLDHKKLAAFGLTFRNGENRSSEQPQTH